MNDKLIIYRCNICKGVFLLPEKLVDYTEGKGDFITCPYYGKTRDVNVIGYIDPYGEVKACMEGRAYKREGRRIKQIK